MISKQALKSIASLKVKKYRTEQKKIFVEGLRVLDEALQSSWHCELLLCTPDFLQRHAKELRQKHFANVPKERISEAEFKTLSDTLNPQGIGGVFTVPVQKKTAPDAARILYLDTISEPGNAGTLIRTALWFGVTDIIFSEGCVELYNPKLIRGAAGSFFYGKYLYDDGRYSRLSELKSKGYQLLGADMTGVEYANVQLSGKSVLILGNEANGLTARVRELTSEYISIPRLGKGESLNVAAAGSILLSRFSGK